MLDDDNNTPSRPARRGFLKTGGAAVAALAPHAASGKTHADDPFMAVEPFFGAHQGGIVTPQQSHSYVAAFDLKTDSRVDLVNLLREWTDADNLASVDHDGLVVECLAAANIQEFSGMNHD